MKHPLDNTFNIDSNGEFESKAFDTSDIPDDPTLDTIIDQSMKMYKSIIEDLNFIEPKNRLRFMETAERLLSQIKDAIYKKEQIALQRERLNQQKMKGKGSSSKQEDSEPGVDRSELYKKIRAVK